MQIPKNTTNKLPQMRGDVGYGLGFFCGCLVGIIGAYVVLTPEGKQLKAKIIKEYQANLQTLTLDELLPKQHQPSTSKSIASIQAFIKHVKAKLSQFDAHQPQTIKEIHPANSSKRHFFRKK